MPRRCAKASALPTAAAISIAIVLRFERPALTEDVGQRTALDVLDDDDRRVGGLDEVEDPENVRMREGAGRLRFARERLLRPPRTGLEDLDGDDSIEHRVEGLVDRAVRTPPNRTNQSVSSGDDGARDLLFHGA